MMAAPARPIVATPFVLRDPASIPPRAWLYGRHYIRGYVSATVGQGGLGKSCLALAEALAMATGRDLLGVPVMPRRVWLWNGEDPSDEIERRVAAVCQHYGISDQDLGGRLFVDSGTTAPIKLARMGRDGIALSEDAIREIVGTIKDNNIDVFIIDPLIACHHVPENDNGAIDAVARVLARIANAAKASVEIVHHVRKPTQGQSEMTVDDARGGSALVNAARSVRVLNRLSAVEAGKAGLGVGDRRRYFRADTGKANLAPPEAAAWFQLVPIALPNGDSVAAVAAWKLPGAMDAVTTDHMHRVRTIVREGSYRKDSRSPEWVGLAIADELGLDPEADLAKLKEILKCWFKSGVLATETRQDQSRKNRTFVIPGNWNEDQELDGAPV
jgi:hypothetical protein